MEDSLTRFRALDDIVGCSYACWYLGGVATKRGEYTQATALYEESLALGRQAGDTWAIASALLNTADLTLELRDFERTIAILRESLQYYRTLRAAWAICIILD